MLDIENIRKEFPILQQKVYGKDLIYLDNAATTQNPVSVIEVSERMQSSLNGNIHRGIHFMAERTTELYEKARRSVQQFLGASSPSEIVFTSGATASINLVAYSFCEEFLKAGDNVIITESEHHSNLVPWQIQTQRRSANLRWIPVNDDGTLNISSETLDSLVDERTKIVAVTAVSNVLGIRNDIKHLISYCHGRGVPVLVDGSQAVQHDRIDVKDIDADFFVFSGHKLFAPTGIGVLYAKENWLESMPPFMAGGDMISRVSLTEGTTWAELPLKFEAGTSNYIGAICLAEAIHWYQKFNIEEVNSHLDNLTTLFASELEGAVDGVTIYGDVPHKAPIVSFNIEGCYPMDVAQIVDKLGLAIRSGTQCAEPLMTRFETQAVCRASMALYNTEGEIISAIAAIKRASEILRRYV